ncbi:hypothetical protein HAX54_031672, partial [Datura stramonium]|nr:hypothetical protein [Datura stramonium]
MPMKWKTKINQKAGTILKVDSSGLPPINGIQTRAQDIKGVIQLLTQLVADQSQYQDRSAGSR